jgi:hypothetical protein
MPIVSAYQCPHTKKLFAIEDKNKYKKHLVALATEQYNARVRQRVAKEKKEFLSKTLWSCLTIGQIEEWFTTNGLWLTRNLTFRKDQLRKKMEPIIFDSFKLDVRWSPIVSNSHNCPVGGVTNWHRKKELPIGYPGYSGTIRYSINNTHGQKSYFNFGSEIFNGTLVNTGGGGGNGLDYQYQVYLFDSDWPNLRIHENLTADYIDSD